MLRKAFFLHSPSGMQVSAAPTYLAFFCLNIIFHHISWEMSRMLPLPSPPPLLPGQMSSPVAPAIASSHLPMDLTSSRPRPDLSIWGWSGSDKGIRDQIQRLLHFTFWFSTCACWFCCNPGIVDGASHNSVICIIDWYFDSEEDVMYTLVVFGDLWKS